MCGRMRKNNWISVFRRKTKSQFSQKWLWPDAYMSRNDDFSSVDRAVAVLMLVAEMWKHFFDVSCTARCLSGNQK